MLRVQQDISAVKFDRAEVDVDGMCGERAGRGEPEYPVDHCSEAIYGWIQILTNNRTFMIRFISNHKYVSSQH